ncbi:MAG TPA: PAAR domain-containing protein [Methyloceanibacter sp.]|nr:PAAR domain-containing protein [Methyloceanibacter sp.]
MNRYALAAVLIIVAGPALAGDQSGQAPCPAGSAITSGSSNVTVGGKQAARAGDTTGCGSETEGSSNVFINGKPAAVQGSSTGCGGSVVTGSSGVFINGKPMVGDATSGCAGK